MPFEGRPKRAQQQFPSPEELYLSGTLPRTTAAVDGLWLHQGDVIRAYAENHQLTPDLALELPTGSGNLTNYIARSLLESGGFRPRLHPRFG